MKKALFATVIVSGLLAGPAVMAGEPKGAYFSGALSYDTLSQETFTPGEDAANPIRSLSGSDIAFDLYRNDFGPLGLSLGGGYSVSGEGASPEAENYRVGLRFDYGGISVASQLRSHDADACSLSDTVCDARPAWHIGASYNAGAASLSAQYQTMAPLGSVETGFSGEVYRFGLDYQFFDGFSSRADAYFIDGDNRLSEGDSTVVLIGTRITF